MLQLSDLQYFVFIKNIKPKTKLTQPCLSCVSLLNTVKQCYFGFKKHILC